MIRAEVLRICVGSGVSQVHNNGDRVMMNDVLQFLNEHRDAAIGVVSAVVALIGAFTASRETRKQRNLMAETLRQRLDGASIRWGDEAIEALAAAEGLARHPESATYRADLERIVQQLSALADRGRLFFPNIEESAKGQDKETAFQGSRPPILDALVFAHKELISLQEGDPPHADFINRCRRLVVSELQDHLDPRHWDTIIERGTTKHADHRKDAERRAGLLQTELMNRRANHFAEETET